MPLSGAEQGNFQTNVNCAGVSASVNIPTVGSAAPNWSINAPPAVSGTMGSSGAFTAASSVTYAGTEKVAVFWTIAGVNYYRYDCTITGGTGTAFTISGGSGSALPSGGQAVNVATNQDITGANGLSLPGNNIQQLLVTSSQPSLVEWLSVTPTQERLSLIATANGCDTWPSSSGQSAPPVGGAGANWTSGDTVVTIRCWNNSANTATIKIGVILT